MPNCFQEALTNIQPEGIFVDSKYIITLYRKVLTAFRSDDVFCLIPLLLKGKIEEKLFRKKTRTVFY